MNWPVGTIRAALAVFVGRRAAGTWVCHRTADRFGAARMARLHRIPMALAFTAFALPLGQPSIWMAFAGIGFTKGANSVLGGTLRPDLVGTVRGMFAAAMIVSSALAPITVARARSVFSVPANWGLRSPAIPCCYRCWSVAGYDRISAQAPTPDPWAR